jgi:hypothetical protein
LVSDTLSLVEKDFCFADHALGNKEIALEVGRKILVFSSQNSVFSSQNLVFSVFSQNLGFLNFDRCRGWLERSAGCQRTIVLVSDTLSLVEKYFCFADHALGNKEIELEMICKTRFSRPKTRFSHPKTWFSRFLVKILVF